MTMGPAIKPGHKPPTGRRMGNRVMKLSRNIAIGLAALGLMLGSGASAQVQQIADVIARAAPTLPLHDDALAEATGSGS